ncbi:unnamed protein product [Closterium sp. NIES-53]
MLAPERPLMCTISTSPSSPPSIPISPPPTSLAFPQNPNSVHRLPPLFPLPPSPSTPSTAGPPKAELYIVELRTGLPLATYRGQIPGYPATAPRDEGPDLDSAFPDDSPEAELPSAPDGLVGGSAEDLWGWPPVNGTDGRIGAEEGTGTEAGAGVGASTGMADNSSAAMVGSAPTDSTEPSAETTSSRGNGRLQFSSSSPQPSSQPSASNPLGSSGGVKRPRLSLKAAHVQAYRQMLQRQQRQVAADIGVAATALVHHFQIVSHGFAAGLTPLQLWRVKRHPAVAAVRRSRIFHKSTFDSPVFLRLPDSLWQTAGGQSSAGADVVVGVIDTGIWPEHSSFDDTGLSGTPATWQGTCETSADFSCNGKLIGARKVYNGFRKESNGGPDFSYDYDSPRDSDGHGTWCAGAAVGAKVSWASGDTSGMAPAARLAVYKVFWADSYGTYASDADIVAAVDHAVADGVDVLSLSLGGSNPQDSYFTDVAFLNANAVSVRGAYTTTPPSSQQAAQPAAIDTASIAAPMVAGFSSRGPLIRPMKGTAPPYPTNSILKPDIIGPGVALWAAMPATAIGDAAGLAQLSGTSMATPHIAGIAALIVQQQPDWSPAQVMSAIMTTAAVRNTRGKFIRTVGGRTATPWQVGAGHVNPLRVLDPGLTYDAGESHYRNFLAGQSMWRAKKLFPGATLRRVAPRNVNRASISIGRMKGYRKVRRTVTNVASTTSTYTGKIVCPYGVVMMVNPKQFTIAPGERVTFTVSVWVNAKSMQFHYGSLTWRDELGHVVRSPIAVQPLRYIKW